VDDAPIEDDRERAKAADAGLRPGTDAARCAGCQYAEGHPRSWHGET